MDRRLDRLSEMDYLREENVRLTSERGALAERVADLEDRLGLRPPTDAPRCWDDCGSEGATEEDRGCADCDMREARKAREEPDRCEVQVQRNSLRESQDCGRRLPCSDHPEEEDKDDE